MTAVAVASNKTKFRHRCTRRLGSACENVKPVIAARIPQIICTGKYQPNSGSTATPAKRVPISLLKSDGTGIQDGRWELVPKVSKWRKMTRAAIRKNTELPNHKATANR